MSVSVTYTYGSPNEAVVTVLLEKNGTDPIQVIPALPALALGDWTVTWNLQAGTGVTNPAFNEEGGIDFTEAPPLLSVSSSQRQSNTQWVVSLTNACESANLVTYGISGTTDQGSFNDDPTVAVTPDPPPGN